MKFENKILLIFLVVIVVLFSFTFVSVAESFELKKGQLKVTIEHPFLQDGEWIEAENLENGDTITTKDGRKATITSIRKVKKNTTVYNLEDAKYHNYIVDGNGDDTGGVVVHNSGPGYSSSDRFIHMTSDEIVSAVKESGYLKPNSAPFQHYVQTSPDPQNALSKISGITPSKQDLLGKKFLVSLGSGSLGSPAQWKKIGRWEELVGYTSATKQFEIPVYKIDLSMSFVRDHSLWGKSAVPRHFSESTLDSLKQLVMNEEGLSTTGAVDAVNQRLWDLARISEDELDATIHIGSELVDSEGTPTHAFYNYLHENQDTISQTAVDAYENMGIEYVESTMRLRDYLTSGDQYATPEYWLRPKNPEGFTNCDYTIKDGPGSAGN